MKRTSRNTLTILIAGLLLAGPALGNGGPSVSENKARGDYSAQPAIGKDTSGRAENQTGQDVGKDSSSMSERKYGGDASAPAVGKDSSSMSERKYRGDSSVSASATSMNDDQVRELQRLLGERGFSPGKIDGIIGPRTQAAIRQFQTANELTVSGNPDQETLRVLAPDAKKQEFFGVAPAYGEAEGVKQQPINTHGGEGIHEQPMKNQPAERMEQPLNQPTNRTEQPLKKGY